MKVGPYKRKCWGKFLWRSGSARRRTDLEEVKGRAGVNTALLVDGADDGGLGALLGGEGGGEVELQALGDLVLELDLVAEDVGSGPSLGDGEAVGLVGPLALEITSDEVGLGVLVSGDLEGDVGRGLGLDLKGGSVEGVVLSEEVVGRLSEVLCGVSVHCWNKESLYSPSRRGERAEAETL